jgi:hypothetical protein
VNNEDVIALLDTGSNVSVINESFAEEQKLKLKRLPEIVVKAIDGCKLRPRFYAEGVKFEINDIIHYCDLLVIKHSKPNVILGMDMISSAKIDLFFSKNEIVSRKSMNEPQNCETKSNNDTEETSVAKNDITQNSNEMNDKSQYNFDIRIQTLRVCGSNRELLSSNQNLEQTSRKFNPLKRYYLKTTKKKKY